MKQDDLKHCADLLGDAAKDLALLCEFFSNLKKTIPHKCETPTLALAKVLAVQSLLKEWADEEDA